MLFLTWFGFICYFKSISSLFAYFPEFGTFLSPSLLVLFTLGFIFYVYIGSFISVWTVKQYVSMILPRSYYKRRLLKENYSDGHKPSRLWRDIKQDFVLEIIGKAMVSFKCNMKIRSISRKSPSPLKKMPTLIHLTAFNGHWSLNTGDKLNELNVKSP